MARAIDQIKASDVTWWGVIALVCWAMAVLAANLSGMLPAGALAALHSSRLEGGTINQLRTQVASLQQNTDRMRRENAQLLQQIAMNQDEAGQMVKRLGALEVSLPKIVEAQSQLESQVRQQAVDATVTGGIQQGQVLTFEAEGGTVAVEQKPLVASDGPGVASLPMPPATPDAAAPQVGVALGPPVQDSDAEPKWQEMLADAGTLLSGVGPVLAPVEGESSRQLVAGPLPDAAAAAALCRKLDAIAIPCEPAAFKGEPLQLTR